MMKYKFSATVLENRRPRARPENKATDKFN
jgi:hypothetical protein